MAGVNMRLEAGAVRELHWHKTAEGPGDLWFFPAGVPHSLQATTESTNGTEFLLVFPDGTFSEDSTFMLTDWTAHIPKEVLAKNFQVDMSAFDNIPGSELYIFPSAPPTSNTAVSNPQGQVPQPYTYAFSQVAATPLAGGSVKIADSSTFNISTQIAVAEITIVPGGMRELHWHPTEDEWGFFLEGQARMTLFASSGNARTYNYEAGDVSYVPATYGHYVENIGNTTLKFIEVFNTGKDLSHCNSYLKLMAENPLDRFQDIGLAQWLALTPPALVQSHLQLSDEMMTHLNKTKQIVVGPVSTS
ncbi:hypothetical protein PHLCEN_2v9041 [Hermanssonia centrifuga]|uniref:Cupin type-1 domain-containing protein n=1 Tax=Hermanssonia centrifuga TaxID=98765 RepID=A0A2R6NRT5_9APHY|nr:hypothetical protein PHLCEN_2v9041 [Hermanssonia centrifuga]